MYETFVVGPVVENLPLKIESLAAYDNRIVVGTADGSLLVYAIDEDPEFSISLLESKKAFSKKSLDSFVIAVNACSLCVLSDQLVSIYNVATLQLRCSLQKSRGAHLISLYSPYLSTPFPKDLDNPENHPDDAVERLCIAVKKKLLFYYFDGPELVERKDISLGDKPQSLTWIDANSVVVALPKGYFHINITTGHVSELLAKGQSLMSSALVGLAPVVGKFDKPTITKLKDNELLLGKDDVSVILLSDGTVAPNSKITWSGYPSDIVYAPPYLVALLPQQIEVRSMRSKETVQVIQLPNAKLVSVGPTILVASSTSIWRLLPLDFEDQIEQLLATSQFKEAQTLIEDLDFSSEEDKIANIIRVRGMQAHHMFTYEKRYAEAIAILQELEGSPLDVINMYPEFNPEYLDSSEPVPTSDRVALQILMDYLTAQRSILAKLRAEYEEAEGFTVPADFSPVIATAFSDRGTQSGSISESGWSVPKFANNEEVSPKYSAFLETVLLSRIVDTTLLKVYLLVNDALVGIFLRVPNQCDLSEGEALLMQHQKYIELIDLYRGKGLHRRALEFMVANESSLKNVVQQMISYLQRLSVEDMDMIMEFTAWILAKDPENGIKVFTEQFDEVSTDVRKRITEFLDRISADLATEYLAHIIDDLHEEDSDLHDRLIVNYISKIVAVAESVEALAVSIPMENVDNAEIFVLRRKLLAFLQTSFAYRVSTMLSLFPDEGLYEERCILLGRLKRHEEAISILVFKLQRHDLAETYCQQNYNREDSESSNLFVILLGFFMQLVECAKLDVSAVLAYMARNGPCMDVAESLQMIPTSVRLVELAEFFEKSLHNLHRTRNVDEIIKNLLLSERLQVQERLIFEQSKRVKISEDKMCSKCYKRIANSVFAWYPDGTILHVYCAKSR